MIISANPGWHESKYIDFLSDLVGIGNLDNIGLLNANLLFFTSVSSVFQRYYIIESPETQLGSAFGGH